MSCRWSATEAPGRGLGRPGSSSRRPVSLARVQRPARAPDSRHRPLRELAGSTTAPHPSAGESPAPSASPLPASSVAAPPSCRRSSSDGNETETGDQRNLDCGFEQKAHRGPSFLAFEICTDRRCAAVPLRSAARLHRPGAPRRPSPPIRRRTSARRGAARTCVRRCAPPTACRRSAAPLPRGARAPSPRARAAASAPWSSGCRQADPRGPRRPWRGRGDRGCP